MGLCEKHCGQNWIDSQSSSPEDLSVMLSGLELILKVGHWEEAGATLPYIIHGSNDQYLF